MLRHAPVFRNVAEIVHSGRYGKPMALVLRDDQYFPIQGMYGSTWRSDVDKAGGGTLIEHSIHDLDVINWVLGPGRVRLGAHRVDLRVPGHRRLRRAAPRLPGRRDRVADQRLAPGHDPAVDPPPRAVLRGGVPLDRGRLPRPAPRRDLRRGRDDRGRPAGLDRPAHRPGGAGQAPGPVRGAEQGVPRRPGRGRATGAAGLPGRRGRPGGSRGRRRGVPVGRGRWRDPAARAPIRGPCVERSGVDARRLG